jgi:8-oxo-dGTP diphosphatase
MKVVTAAIIQDQERYFVARRGPGEKLAGLWEFPGGKVEPGETLQESLTREIKEELGVEAVVGRVLAESKYKYAHGEILLVGLQTEIKSNDIKLSVHDKAEWLLPAQILALELAPADIPIAKFLMESKNDL